MHGSWTTVERARDPARPRPPRFVTALVRDFVELHGDRVAVDDPGVLAGVGTCEGHRAVILAQRHGAQGVGAGGLRKAVRMLRLAERFDLPLITFVDDAGLHRTDGGHGALWPAVGATLEAFLGARVPLVAVLCGEGVSGVAVALSVCDRLIVLEHAYIAPVSPEGAAAILWRDPARAADAAALMGLGAQTLMELGLGSRVVLEPGAGLTDVPALLAATGAALREELALCAASVGDHAGRRRERYRALPRLPTPGGTR
ncbi:MAG TPA: carboxyl transferase domain-containing protein [Myxococcota bacterium]|nr:carboxyl transferase domain-containing protein [Myxococcota bacterium]